ncbi:hypothetical protein OG21DRAFT_1605387, partial [Imleria badia]
MTAVDNVLVLTLGTSWTLNDPSSSSARIDFGRWFVNLPQVVIFLNCIGSIRIATGSSTLEGDPYSNVRDRDATIEKNETEPLETSSRRNGFRQQRQQTSIPGLFIRGQRMLLSPNNTPTLLLPQLRGVFHPAYQRRIVTLDGMQFALWDTTGLDDGSQGKALKHNYDLFYVTIRRRSFKNLEGAYCCVGRRRWKIEASLISYSVPQYPSWGVWDAVAPKCVEVKTWRLHRAYETIMEFFVAVARWQDSLVPDAREATILRGSVLTTTYGGVCGHPDAQVNLGMLSARLEGLLRLERPEFMYYQNDVTSFMSELAGWLSTRPENRGCIRLSILNTFGT